MNNFYHKKSLLISPLIGGVCSYFFYIIYYYFSVAVLSSRLQLESIKFWLDTTYKLLFYSPLIIICFVFISYLFSLLIGPFIYKFNDSRFLSSGNFWFLSCLTGSLLGLICGFISYYYYHNIISTIFIILCFTFGSLFNSSLFSVLTGEIKQQYKFKNE